MPNARRRRTDSGRRELLLRMYDQMFNDIDRHINIVWQPITVLVGSAALLVAGTQQLISIDIAVALVILLVGWLIATIYDSSYWYNRNLVIIANIERQFLRQSDLTEIHYYFGAHRRKQSMLTHLRIQWLLALGIGLISLAYHIVSQRLSLFCWISNHSSGCPVEVLIPYVVVGAAIWGYVVKWQRGKSYENFIKNSPGIKIDTTGIEYGIGHPVDKKLKMG
jgi:hypothetical protein